jgi:hypothetical protein
MPDQSSSSVTMGYMIPSLAAFSVFFVTLVFAPLLAAQNNWFQPGMVKEPTVAKALQSIDDRSSAIVDEWIHLVEIPAPSGKEQARAEYIRAEMQKLGLADVRVDDMLNVSGVRKGTGGGPTVVFAAHTDSVFPEGTPIHVRREGDTLTAPGVGDIRNVPCTESRWGEHQGGSGLPRFLAGGSRTAWRQTLAGNKRLQA